MTLLLAGCANGLDRSRAGAVPLELQDEVLADFEAEYGPVETIFGSATTTLAAWRTAEPNNTSGFDLNPNEDTTIIYALFVRGTFTVTGPPSRSASGNPQTATHGAGRIVFDEAAMIWNVRLWPESRVEAPFSNANPPFSPAFDG